MHRVWDLATGKCKAVLEGHTSYPKCVAISPDGCTCVSTADPPDASVRWVILYLCAQSVTLQ